MPMPSEAIASAAIPALTTRAISWTPSAPTRAQRITRAAPVITIARGVGSISSSVSAHGAPR